MTREESRDNDRTKLPVLRAKPIWTRRSVGVSGVVSPRASPRDGRSLIPRIFRGQSRPLPQDGNRNLDPWKTSMRGGSRADSLRPSLPDGSPMAARITENVGNGYGSLVSSDEELIDVLGASLEFSPHNEILDGTTRRGF